MKLPLASVWSVATTSPAWPPLEAAARSMRTVPFPAFGGHGFSGVTTGHVGPMRTCPATPVAIGRVRSNLTAGARPRLPRKTGSTGAVSPGEGAPPDGWDLERRGFLRAELEGESCRAGRGEVDCLCLTRAGEPERQASRRRLEAGSRCRRCPNDADPCAGGYGPGHLRPRACLDTEMPPRSVVPDVVARRATLDCRRALRCRRPSGLTTADRVLLPPTRPARA